MLHHLLYHCPASHPERSLLSFIRDVGHHGRDGRSLRPLDVSRKQSAPEPILAAHGIRVVDGHILVALGPGVAATKLREDSVRWDYSFAELAALTPGAEVVRRDAFFDGVKHARHLRVPLDMLPDVAAPLDPTERNGKRAEALARFLSKQVGERGETLLELALKIAPAERDGRKIRALRRRGEIPEAPPQPEEILWKHRLRVQGDRLHIIMATEEIQRVIGCHPDDIKLGVAGSRLNPTVSAVPGTYNGRPQRNAASRMELPLASLESWIDGGQS